MNHPLYKPDDLVTCTDSEELVQPLRVVCLHPWGGQLKRVDGSNLFVYSVLGVHRKKGNTLTVTLSENQMRHHEAGPI